MLKIACRRRAWLLGFALFVGVFGVAAGPALARPLVTARLASACSTSWKSAVSGDWATAANWDHGVPTSSSDVCITVAGTYTVTLEGNANTVNSLTLGGSSGSQTLRLGSTCAQPVVLTVNGSTTNNARGVIQLTNADACSNSATLLSAIANAGSVQTLVASGGVREMDGDITNTGTITVNQPLFLDGSGFGGKTLTNNGAIVIANNTKVNAFSTAVTNGTGGSIVGVGNGVWSQLFGSFTEGVGTTSGSEPVVLHQVDLMYVGSGASTVVLQGPSTLSGDIAAGQTLNLEAFCGSDSTVTDKNNFSNAGTINFTSEGGCGGAVLWLGPPTNTLTNAGLIQVIAPDGSTSGGQIDGSLTNTGTVSLLRPFYMLGAGTTFTNEGAVTIADGVTLNPVDGASFSNLTGGSISASGNGAVVLSTSNPSQRGTFTEGAGTTSGAKPVILRYSNLVYNGSGASTIALRGTLNTTVSGNIATGQTLSIEGECGGTTHVSAAAGFTNAGTIDLTESDGCANGAVLTIPSGTLTNTGLIASLTASGGQRALLGSLANAGTLQVDQPLSFSQPGSVLTNTGEITVADGVTLAASGGATVTNGAGGSINATGTGALVESGGTFREATGITTGNEPVIVDDGTLKYTGTGASTIGLRGSSTLTAGPAGGQTLVIESTCGENAAVSRIGDLTSAGTITLGNADGCANDAALNVSGTFFNKGKLYVLAAIGGNRTITGTVANSRVVRVDAGETLTLNGAYSQATTGTFATSINASGATGELVAAGALNLDGVLAISRDSSYQPTTATLPLLSGSGLAGQFAKETGAVIAGARYFLPGYTATAASITVTSAKLTRSPTSGHAGASVHLTGTNLPPNDSIALKFTDANGAKTALGTVTTDSSGSFATDVTVPATAALGKGLFTAKSAFASVAVSAGFTVG